MIRAICILPCLLYFKFRFLRLILFISTNFREGILATLITSSSTRASQNVAPTTSTPTYTLTLMLTRSVSILAPT